MVVADLHVHTTHSDGSLSRTELPAAAGQAGLDAVAITDHDRIQPNLDPVTTRNGITLIHGIELRVQTDQQRLDLLGYGVEPTAALREECDRIQRDRRERGRKMIDCVEDRVDVSLPVEPRAGLGRPHIARAIASVSEYSVDGAFDHLIGDDGPCYVPREIPSFRRGRKLLSEACRLVGLAHPFRYNAPDAALKRSESLDAVERWYPYDRSVATDRLEAIIDTHDLLPTGGSDAHGNQLGATGLDSAAWDRVREAIV
jgi:predicted metal-dependent phosphoesterase TrpH